MAPTPEDRVNEVVLVGRISGFSERELPIGDSIATFRVVVDRPVRDRGPGGRVLVDALECVAWRGEIRRRLGALEEGTTVRVSGPLRRRFWQASGSATSRTEVEVREARRIRP